MVRSRLGRPDAAAEDVEKAKLRLKAGDGIVRIAKELGLGVGTVHKLKRQMAVAS